MDCARALDQFDISMRYPDSLPGITPGQAYGKPDAARAIACAEAIFDGCREWLLSVDKIMSVHENLQRHSRESGNPVIRGILDARAGGHDDLGNGHD